MRLALDGDRGVTDASLPLKASTGVRQILAVAGHEGQANAEWVAVWEGESAPVVLGWGRLRLGRFGARDWFNGDGHATRRD